MYIMLLGSSKVENTHSTFPILSSHYDVSMAFVTVNYIHNKADKLSVIEASMAIKQIKYRSYDTIDFTFRCSEKQTHARDLVEALKSIDIKNAIISFTSASHTSSSKLHTQGLMALPVFLHWMSSLGVDQTYYPALTKFYKQFDIHSNMLADTSEILCGLLCFSSGSKSQKLSIAFSLFDETGEGFITRRMLWQILRSFSRSLLLFCDFNLSSDDISVCSASKIFNYYRNPRHVTLEDVSDWYLFSGNDISFWIELLDTSKWIDA